MASLRRSARLQVKKAEYDEKFIRFAREQRRLKCRKAACGFSPVRAQNKLEPFPYEDDSPFSTRSQRISLALTGLFSSAKKSSPKPKYGGRNRRQYVAQVSAAQVSKSFDSSDSSADLVTPQRDRKTLELSPNTALNSDDCTKTTTVPTSAGSSPATEKFNSVKKLKTPVVVLEQLPQCCISSSPVRAFGETADFSRFPVPSEISSNGECLASPGWNTASTCSYHDYDGVCLNKPCADDEPKPYNRETQNDKLMHGPGKGLVFASLEIADNERVDNETLGDMLEVCARMAEIHPEETESSDNYPSTSATFCNGASRYNMETCYQYHTNPYPEGDEPGWQMDETECAVQSLLEQSFQADQPTLNQGAESANLLSGAGTLNKASQELPGKYPGQQSMLQVDLKQDGSGEGSKQKRGRPKKHKTPCKVPHKGVSKKTSQHKVTKKAAGQRDVKMKAEVDAKSETTGKPDRPPRVKKASQKYYICTFCKFRTPDKVEKAAHDKVCHPHRCSFCQRHFFTQENLAVHKATCVLENFQQCKVCDQGYTKSRRKRHFHSRKHSHLVKMVRDVGKALQRGSLESYLASITCDHLSDCQVCHPAWINLDQELEEQPNGDQTEGVKQNPMDSESPQIKKQGVLKDVSSAVITGSASENLQGAASLLSEGNCFVYTTPPEGCDSHSFQNAGTVQEQVYDVFQLDNQSAGSVQEHDLATFCSGDQNTGSLQNHDLTPCHLGGKNAGSTDEHDLTVFHLDSQNLESLQECKLTAYDLDEQRSQTKQQCDLSQFYYGNQRAGFLQEPDLAPYNFGNESAGPAQENDLTMGRFGNQSTRLVQENNLTTCHFGSQDFKSVETPDFTTCCSEKQKLQSVQEQGSKCHTRNHSPMSNQQVLIESGPFQGQVITVYNPESQVVAGSQSSVINPTPQEVAMHDLQDITKLEGNTVDYSDMQNRLAVNNHDSANFPAVSKHTSISYSLQNDSSVKLQEGFLNPCFLTEQTDECELETQPASSDRDSLADPSSDRQNRSTTSRVDVPDTVLYCRESLTSLLLGQTDAQELGTQPADCSKSSIIDTSPDPQRQKNDTSTSAVHAAEALSCQEKSMHSCESASQDADTFTDLLELLDECDLSSADLPDETVGGLDIMEICEDSSSDDGDDTSKAIEQGQDLKELTPVQCAAGKRAAQGEVTKVVDRNLFKNLIQQLTAGEKSLVGGSVCMNRKSSDEKLLPAPARDGSGVGSSGKDATCNELGITQSIDGRGCLHSIAEGFVKAHENARSRAAAEGKPDGAVNRTKSHDRMVPRQSGKGSLQGDTADVGQDRELLQLCYSAQNNGPQDGTLYTHHLEHKSFTDYEKHPQSVSASVVTVSLQLAPDTDQETENIQNQACPMEKTDMGICISTGMTNVMKQEISCADSDTARFSDIMDMVMFDATQELLDAVSTQTETSIRCASPASGIPLVANGSDIDITPRPSNETLSWLPESLSPTSNIVSATASSLMTLDADLSEATSGSASSRVTSTAIIPTVGIMAVNSSDDPTTDAGILSQGIKAVSSPGAGTSVVCATTKSRQVFMRSPDESPPVSSPTTKSRQVFMRSPDVSPPVSSPTTKSRQVFMRSPDESPPVSSPTTKSRQVFMRSPDLSPPVSSPTTETLQVDVQGARLTDGDVPLVRQPDERTAKVRQVVESTSARTKEERTVLGIPTKQGVSVVTQTHNNALLVGQSDEAAQAILAEESLALKTPADESMAVVRPRDESPSVVSPTDESPTVVRPRDESLSVVRPRDESPTVVRPRDESLSVVRPRDESPTVVRPSDESPTVVRPSDESLSVVSPRDESLSVVRPRDESPSVVRPRDESPSVVRPRDESPSVVRPRDESPSVVRSSDESPTVVRPSDESPTVVRPSDESLSVVRPSDESPTVVRPRDESPTEVRPSDESLSVFRPRDENPTVVSLSVFRPRDESPTVVRPSDESLSVFRPRDESMLAADEGTAVVGTSDERTCMVRTRNESTAVLRPRDESTPAVGLAGESSPVVTPRDQSTPAVGLAGESSPVVTPRDQSPPAVGLTSGDLMNSAVGTPKASTVSTLIPSAVGTPRQSAVCTPKPSAISTQPPRYCAVGTPKPSHISTQTPTQTHSAVCTPKPGAKSRPTPRYGSVSTSTQRPLVIKINIPLPRPTAANTATPMTKAVGTATTMTKAVGTAASKPTVLSAPTSNTTTVGTPTSNPTTLGTSTSNPITIDTPTSNPPTMGTPTSKHSALGTPTSKPTTMGTPTSKPTTMGTHTLKPIFLSTPTSNVATMGTPTSKATTMGTPTSKPTTIGNYTLEPIAVDTPTSKPTTMGTPTSKPTALSTPTSSIVTMGTPAFKPSAIGTPTSRPAYVGTPTSNPTTMGTPAFKPTTMGTPTSKSTALSTPTSSIVNIGTLAFKPNVVGTPTSWPADVGTPTSNVSTLGTPAFKPSAMGTPKLQPANVGSPTSKPTVSTSNPTTIGTPALKQRALGTPTSKPTAVSTSVPAHASSISRSIPRHADARTPSPRPTCVTTPRLRATGPHTPTPRPSAVSRPICTYRAVKTPIPRHSAMRVTPRLGTESTPTSKPSAPSTPMPKPIAVSTPTPRCSAVSRPVCTCRPTYTCSAVISPMPKLHAVRSPMQGPIVSKPTSRPTAVNSPTQGPTPVNSPTFKPVGVATPTYRPVVKGIVPRPIAPNNKRPRGSILSTIAPTPQSPSTPSLRPSALSTRAYHPTATSSRMSGTSTRGVTPRSTIAGTHLSATFPVGTPIPGPRVVNTSTSSLQDYTNIAMITPSSASGCGMKVTKDSWQHCSGVVKTEQAETQYSQQLSDYTPSLSSLASVGMRTKGTVRRLKFGEGLISTCRQDTQRCGQSSRKRSFCNQESTGMENCDRKAARSSNSHRVAIGMDFQAKSTRCEKTTMSCSSRKRSTHLPGGDLAARSSSKAPVANISKDNGCTALLTGAFPTTSSRGKLCARTEPTLMPSSTSTWYTSDKEEHLSHTRRSTILAPRNQQHTVPETDRFCPASAAVKRRRQEIVTNAHTRWKCSRKNPLFPFASASQPKKPKLCERERDTHEGRSHSELCNRAVTSQVVQRRDDDNIPTLQKAKDSQLSVVPHQNVPGVRPNTCDPVDLQVAHNTFSDDSKSADIGDSVKDLDCSREKVGPAEPGVTYDTNSYLISRTVIPGNISLSRYDGTLPTVYVSHLTLPDSQLSQSVSARQNFHHELQYLTSPISADTETPSPFMQAVAYSRAGMSNPFVPVSVAARTSMEDRNILLHRLGLNSFGSSEPLMPALLANSFHQGIEGSFTSQMKNATACKIEHQIILLP